MPVWINRRVNAVLVALVLVAAACSGTESATSSTSETTIGTTAASTNAPSTTSTPIAAGEFRCERLGYACSWADVPAAISDQVDVIGDEVAGIIDTAADPVTGIEQALEYLEGRDDIVEVIGDTTTYTSVMFRIEGAPPMVILTELAAPQGEPYVHEGPDLVQAVADPGATALPALSTPGVNAVLADFRPTGGPIEAKRGIVLDPYATQSEDCGGGVADGDCYRTPKGRVEGSLVAAVMGNHPQISVDYLAGKDVTPEVVGGLSGYDLVHIASHGSNACGGFEWFENAEFDPNKCYTVVLLGPIDVDARQASPAAGVWKGRDAGEDIVRWAVTTEYIASALGSESIVFANFCTSGDGGLGRAGSSTRSFVGWHSYARMNAAAASALEFWRLMVEDGVSFDLAIDRLVAQGLHETFPPQVDPLFGLIPVGVGHSTLVTGGKDQRARDVIETRIGVKLAPSTTIETVGIVGDGENQVIESVDFIVDGVEEGTEDSTIIKVLIDGKELDREIKVSDGTPLDQKDGYAKWAVTVENLDIGFDLTVDEVDPSDPQAYKWETRVYVSQSEYSAHEADPVHFGGTIRAIGEVGMMAAVDARLRKVGGAVVENLLTVQFPSSGGPATGEFRAVIQGPDQAGGSGVWEIELDGTYDKDTGKIEGEAWGQGFDPRTGIFTDEIQVGVLEATVDLSGRTVIGVMYFSYGDLDFIATVVG